MSKKQSPFSFYPIATNTKTSASTVDSSVIAGFPCPIDGACMRHPIDLNKELIKHQETTFLLHVVGDSMINEGVDDGDVLIVDRSAKPKKESLLLCICKGEHVLNRIARTDDGLLLVSDESQNQHAAIATDDMRVLGVVTCVMKKKFLGVKCLSDTIMHDSGEVV